MLLELPIELVREVVGRWLVLRDIGRLDSAFCESLQREVLFQNVYPFVRCSTRDRRWVNPTDANQMLKFGLDRQISFHDLKLVPKIDLATSAAYLKTLGRNVECIELADFHCDSVLLDTTAKYCDTVKEIKFTNCYMHKSHVNVISNCVALDFLYFDDVFVKLITYVRPSYTHHVRLKRIDLRCCSADAEKCVFGLCAPDALLQLRLTHVSAVPRWSDFVNLVSLGFNDMHSVSDQMLLRVLTYCPSIVDLYKRNVILLSEEGIVAALAVVKDVRSLNVENIHVFKNVGLRALIEQHNRSLQKVYLHGTGVSGSEINHAFRECPQLCKLSHSTGGVDYSLMGRMVLLATDYVYLDSAACRAMVKTCHRMGELHLRCYESLKDLWFYHVAEAVLELHALRSLHLLCSSGCMDENHPIDRLRAQQRPTLRVQVHTTRAWGDFFNIPI